MVTAVPGNSRDSRPACQVSERRELLFPGHTPNIQQGKTGDHRHHHYWNIHRHRQNSRRYRLNSQTGSSVPCVPAGTADNAVVPKTHEMYRTPAHRQ